jgi:putative metallohydrolase (TIGR04338 family)
MSCSCQQFQLYAAEASIIRGASFRTKDECQQFVDELRDLDWWERNFPQVKRVEVFWRSRGSSSVGSWHEPESAGVIEMLPCHRNVREVLHEVTHVLCSARYGPCGHNPWFARTYLELVYSVMGSEAYAELAASFDRAGIDHDTDNSNPAARFAL